MPVDDVDMRIDHGKARPGLELVAEDRQGTKAQARQVTQEAGIDAVPGRHQHGHEALAMEIGQSRECRSDEIR